MSPATVAERERKRALFRKNQLALVVSQIRFPRLPRFMDERYTVAFEEAMRGNYPKTVREPSMNLVVSEEGLKRHEGPRQLRFTTIDDDYSVVLASDFIAMECRRFDCIEAFLDRFLPVVAEAAKCFELRHQLRVGLRFVNEFRNPEKLTYDAWKDLFHEKFIGWDPSIMGGDVLNTIAEFSLQRDDGKFVMRRGFLTGTTVKPLPNQVLNPQQFYLFDMDYFDDTARPFEVNASTRLHAYNAFMYKTFDWAISPEMKRMLGYEDTE